MIYTSCCDAVCVRPLLQPAFQFQSKIGISRRSDLVVCLISFSLACTLAVHHLVLQCKTWRKKGKRELNCLSVSSVSKALFSFGWRKDTGELVILSAAVEILDCCLVFFCFNVFGIKKCVNTWFVPLPKHVRFPCYQEPGEAQSKINYWSFGVCYLDVSILLIYIFLIGFLLQNPTAI